MIFEARVKTGRNKFAITKTAEGFDISVKGQPREGEANAEIARELSRLTGRNVLSEGGQVKEEDHTHRRH